MVVLAAGLAVEVAGAVTGAVGYAYLVFGVFVRRAGE